MLAKLALCFCLLGKLLALSCAPPVVLSDTTAFSVKVVTNDKGDAVAMWVSEQKEGEVVFASTKTHDTAWSTPERISKVEEEITMPRVVIDAQGNIFASWVMEVLDEETVLQIAEKSFGSAWNKPANIASTDGYTQFEDGHLKSVATVETVGKWSPDFSTSPKRILSATKELHKDVQFEYVAQVCCGSYTNLSVASNKAGTVFAIWERKTADGEYLWEYAWHRPGMYWTPIEQVSGMPSSHSWKMHAVIDADENITLLGKSKNGKLMSLSRSRGVWSDPVIVSEERASNVKLSIDDAGNIFITWLKKNGHQDVLSAVYKSSGKTWQDPIILSPEEYDCCCYDIKPDHQGNFVACWGQSDDNSTAIHGACFSTKEQKWSVSTQLSPEGFSCWSPMLAFSKEKGFLGWVTQEHVEVVELGDQ